MPYDDDAFAEAKRRGNGHSHDDSGLVAIGSAGEAPWPAAMDWDAYHGVLGRIVREALAPHTEAAEEALLLHLLGLVGNFLGRDSYVEADGARHAPNLNVVFVGPTSTGRKGSAYSQARQLLPWDYLRDQVIGGLSTGEGLIHAVRDRETAVEDDGITTKVVDLGIVDKRKVVVGEEFSRTLRAMTRSENTLSAILRLAWDGRDLATLTRAKPMRATEPHISVIAHITPEELRNDLTDISAANGLGNRFIFICVKRKKSLPFGGKPDPQPLALLRDQLLDAITDTRRGEIAMDAEAKTLWRMHYDDLTDEQAPGMLGAICARGATQVLRLALLYALIDKQELIGADHLRGGLAVWEYAKGSARYIFGDSIGDPAADKIMAALRASPKGLKRADISALFGNNRDKADIDTRLALLFRYGRATRRTGRAGSLGGRRPKSGLPHERGFLRKHHPLCAPESARVSAAPEVYSFFSYFPGGADAQEAAMAGGRQR
jgi:hypothetical protein